MKCPFCKHGSTHTDYASITLERDGATLFFKSVLTNISDNCGEIYHDEEVTKWHFQQRGVLTFALAGKPIEYQNGH